MSPLDLHVLSTPPAFVLSQDQTLSFNPVISLPVSQPARLNSFGITVSYLRFFVLYRFQGSVPRSRFWRVPQRQATRISYQTLPQLSTPFLNFFYLFSPLFAFANANHTYQSYHSAYHAHHLSIVRYNRSALRRPPNGFYPKLSAAYTLDNIHQLIYYKNIRSLRLFPLILFPYVKTFMEVHHCDEKSTSKRVPSVNDRIRGAENAAKTDFSQPPRLTQ